MEKRFRLCLCIMLLTAMVLSSTMMVSVTSAAETGPVTVTSAVAPTKSAVAYYLQGDENGMPTQNELEQLRETSANYGPSKQLFGEPLERNYKGCYAWTSEYLIIDYYQKGRSNSFCNDSVDVWEDDSLEIYIDANHNHSTAYDAYDFQFIKGAKDNSIFEKNNRTAGVQHSCITNAWSVRYPNGREFFYEDASFLIAVPWSLLGVTPQADMSLGIDMGWNHDVDGGFRDCQFVWNGTVDNYTDTSSFGDIVLSAIPGAEYPLPIPGVNNPPSDPQNFRIASENIHKNRTITLAWDPSVSSTGLPIDRYKIVVEETAGDFVDYRDILYSYNGATSIDVTIPFYYESFRFSLGAYDSGGNQSNNVYLNYTPPPEPAWHTTNYSAERGKSLDVDGYTVTDLYLGDKSVIGDTDNSGHYGVRWNDDYIYFSVNVIDLNMFNDSDNPWEDDSIEIYIDPQNNKSTTFGADDRQIIIGYGDDTAAVYGGPIDGMIFKQVEFVRSYYVDYRVEVAIPWASLGIDPKAGTSMGFDIGVNDDDNGGGRDSQLMLNGTIDNYRDTSQYKTLFLWY